MVNGQNKKQIDGVIDEFSKVYKNRLPKVHQAIAILFLTFALLGLVWCIPFPHLSFLGQYNGFINWASFLISFSVYYYYKISPVLSYGILLVVFAFSAGIVGLEKLHTSGICPHPALLCFILFTVGSAVYFSEKGKENFKPTIAGYCRFVLNGPLWLMYSVFSYFGFRA